MEGYLYSQVNFIREFTKAMFYNSSNRLPTALSSAIRKHGCFSEHFNIDYNVSGNYATPSITKLYNDWQLGTFAASIFLSVFITISNTAFIYGMWKVNAKFNATHKLFIYQSVTDLLTGLIAMPMMSVYLWLGLNCTSMRFMISVSTFSLINGSFTFLNISVLRLITTLKPFAHKKNHFSLYTALIFQTIVSVTITCFVDWLFQYAQSGKYFAAIFYIVMFASISIDGTIVVSSVATFAVLRFKTQKEIGVKYSKSQFKQHQHAAITVLIIAMMMTISVIAHAVISILIVTNFESVFKDIDGFFTFMVELDVMMVVVSINPGINSIVCMSRSQAIKKFYKTKFWFSSVSNIDISK